MKISWMTVLRRLWISILAGCFATAVSASEVTYHSLGKGLYYDQTAGGAPVLKSPMPWLVQAQFLTVSNISFGQVKWAPFNSRGIGQRGESNVWLMVDRAVDESRLNVFWPTTNYWFQIFTLSGSQLFLTNSLNSGTVPNAPTITNLVAAQNVDASQDFVLQWDAFSGGTSADFIFCKIQSTNTVFNTSFTPDTPGALNGTNTSLVIPAGTLQPGRAYIGRLFFGRTMAGYTNTALAATGRSFVFSQTDFRLITQGPGDNVPPQIVASSPTNGAVNVPTNQTIVVTFNKPVNWWRGIRTETGFNSGGGGGQGGVTGGSDVSFSADRTQMGFTPQTGYSLNVSHVLILNPSEGLPGFADDIGNPLAAETCILFTDNGTTLPAIRGLLDNPRSKTNGVFEVDLIGATNASYELHTSTNGTNWTSIRTNVAFQGRAQFIDTNASAPLRFYRATGR